VEVRSRMEDGVEKAFHRPCLYTSEEKLDMGLPSRVVSRIRAVVRGTDTRYISRKPMSMSQKPWYVGLVLDVGMIYTRVSDVGVRYSTSVGWWCERREMTWRVVSCSR
jgi:hypothetical protein